jgi:nicotinic acid mononucleotide adenylyltransferase
LTCLEHALQDRCCDDFSGEKGIIHQETTSQGDQISITIPRPVYCEDPKEEIRLAAERIVSGECQSVALVPFQGQFMALSKTILPPKSIVFPGSFNPAHKGHVQLAQAALDKTECKVAWFELSLTNADKPCLEEDQVVERLERFLKLDIMPEHWGVILVSVKGITRRSICFNLILFFFLQTNAPLFKQKVDLLNPLQVSRSFLVPPLPLHFVIGTDTLVRLIDPKYYNNSKDEMLSTLEKMPCHFVVGGRLTQKTDSPTFVTGKEEVQRLPASLQSKFTLLGEFRVDISSTELRKEMSTTSSGNGL